MGCNNSNTLPEPISDIRKTISKIAPQTQTCTEKKIAKNFKTFTQFLDELKLMLKQDGFYDYLFRAEYFEEMLQLISSTYVNHQEAVKIIAIVLEYMALTKNFINGRHVLKSRFNINTLASQLSKRWTEIRSVVFNLNKNALKTLNYLARKSNEQKCWFSHSFLDLKFNFSLQQSISVANNVQQLCKIDEKTFFYMSNYFFKCCELEFKRTQAVTVVEEKLVKSVQQLLIDIVQPLPLNGQEFLFEHHKNFKANLQQHSAFSLDLTKAQPNERVKLVQGFIFQKAKASIESFNKFNQLFQSICYKSGCSNYCSEVRLKSRSQKKEILKIKAEFIGFQAEKKSLTSMSKAVKIHTLDHITNLEYQLHEIEVNSFCETFCGMARFKISNMLKSQCMFNDLIKLNDCCEEILKELTKNGYKLIELSNKLRGGYGPPHILLHVLIDRTICQFKLIFNYNLGLYRFVHNLGEMTKSKHLSHLTKLKLFNEEITTRFIQETNEIIQANSNGKIDYGQRLLFSQAKSLFKELINILPISVDLSKKAHTSIDFNIIFEEIEQYKLIVEQFINQQIRIDRIDKIRRIAEYLFYQKKYDLSEVLFSLYEKEIQENHAYLMDKMKNKCKDFIKTQVQLVEFYAESIHFLAKIHQEKQAYSKSIEYYEKYLPLINLVHQNQEQQTKILKKIAQNHIMQTNFDEAVKLYHQCIQIEGKNNQDTIEINHLIAVVYTKQKKLNEALKIQTDCLHIIEKKHGKGLQYEQCLKHIIQIFKLNGNYVEGKDRIEKRRQVLDKLQSKYTLQYSELMRQLGFFQQKIGDINKAILHYQESLQILTKVEGNYFEATQRLYAKIGNLHLQIGNYSEAIKNFKNGLSLSDKILGVMSQQSSSILNNMGFAYQHLSQYEEAYRCFERSSGIKKQKFGSKSIEYIRAIIGLAVLFDQQGNTTEALKRYQQALNLLQQTNHIESADHTIILNNIGLVQQERSNYQKSLEYFSKAQSLSQSIYGKQSKEYANTLNNIGMVKDDMCKYTEALADYKICLAIYQKLKDNKGLLAATFNNIGTTLFHLADFSQALKYYQKSLNLQSGLKQNETRQYSMCLHSIGMVKFQQDRLEQAEKLYEQSKSILKNASISNNLDHCQILISLGKLYLKRGHLDQSLVYFDEALNILGSSNDKSKALLIVIYLNKGIAFLRLRRYQQSIENLNKSLKLCKDYNLKYRQYALIHYYLGLTKMEKQQYFKAINDFKYALRLQQQYHDKNWKMTASKLATCSLINQDQESFKVYIFYLEEQSIQIKNRKYKQNKNENSS